MKSRAIKEQIRRNLQVTALNKGQENASDDLNIIKFQGWFATW